MEKLLSVKEAAAALGLDERVIRHRLQLGHMAGQKIGQRAWAIERAEVERWKGRRLKPGPKARTPAAPPPGEGD